MKVRIDVTQQDIDKGKANIKSICGCPIWHAFRRVIPTLSNDLRLPAVSYAKDGNKRFDLPTIARTWQTTGMNGDNIYPFSFDVEV